MIPITNKIDDITGWLRVAPRAWKIICSTLFVVYFGVIFIGSWVSFVKVSRIEVREGVIEAPDMVVSQ